MSKLWRFNLHGHLAMLPFTLGYALFCFVVYRARSWGFRNGVLIAIGGVRENGTTRIFGDPNGQTIAAMTVFDSTTDESKHDELHAHENSHVVQAMIACLVTQAATPLLFLALGWSPLVGLCLGGFLGVPLYSLAYGASFFALWLASGFGPWEASYRRIPFEVWAYANEDRYMTMTPEQKSKVWT